MNPNEAVSVSQKESSEMSVNSLPRFSNPPVVETVIGVQFEAVPKLVSAHLGAFWSKLRKEWPNVSDAAPLEPQYERFDSASSWNVRGLRLKLMEGHDSRLQIRNNSNDRLIQVQNGRLHYNWVGHDGGEYPSYGKMRREFDRVLEEFRQFLKNNSLEDMKPNQWEVTYVNHIPIGTVWNEPEDWANVVPSLVVSPTSVAGIRLESLNGEWHYEIEPKQGRLHVNLSHGKRKADGKDREVLVMTLTARGAVDSDGDINLDKGLNLGHETIVRSFKELTSEKAHKYWELLND